MSNSPRQRHLCSRAKGIGAISSQGVPECHAEAQPVTRARCVSGMHCSICIASEKTVTMHLNCSAQVNHIPPQAEIERGAHHSFMGLPIITSSAL